MYITSIHPKPLKIPETLNAAALNKSKPQPRNHQALKPET